MLNSREAYGLITAVLPIVGSGTELRDGISSRAEQTYSGIVYASDGTFGCRFLAIKIELR